MYDGYDKTLIILELLKPYIAEQQRLFKVYNKELLSLTSKVKIEDTARTLSISECLKEVQRYQYGYNAAVGVQNKIHEVNMYAKEEHIKKEKSPFLSCNIAVLIQQILDSDECVYVLKDIAYAYYKTGRLNECIGTGIPANSISVELHMLSLLSSRKITKGEYTLNIILLRALLEVEQFKNEGATKVIRKVDVQK